ncbi:aromatic compound dioxygenase [Saccharata proteae CBS 121410]|uniref:Aromatic compound dioxygenase n=1 Tax=Saccharata proteae CBS 121410 TaxID=1314787 RepID=A0A9P4HXV8_9PEZI|nr:aromatic compound dioxygenase [Saccharata proteae CBS 121410]
MVNFNPALLSLALSLFAGDVLAHPGHSGTAETKQRSEYMATAKHTSLDHCAAKMKARGTHDQAIARRDAMVEKLRKERGIEKKEHLRARDITDVLNTDHESNLTGITVDTDPGVLFGSVPSCILSPEVTEGPYYVSGETVRSNVIDGQDGVPLYVDIQVVDSITCEPLSNVAIDFWHCNSTGVYGGVVASNNGNEADTANLQNKMLRGIQYSDEEGVLGFETIVPGHYTGRTNHIHVLSQLNSTTLPNGTVTAGQISHVGQLFFDQSLLSLVEAVEPYASNTQVQLLNSEDSIMVQESLTSDPVVEYVLLSDTVADGIFSWINFGIDTSINKTVSAAASCYADGCVANEAGGAGAPGGGGGIFPSGFPTGLFPTGFLPSTLAPRATQL